MTVVELVGIPFVQKDLKMILVAPTVSQIRKLVYVFRKSKDNPDALQRQLVPRKIKDIQQSGDDDNSYFPNSIVVNLTEVGKIKFESLDNDLVRMTFEVREDEEDDESLENPKFRYGYIIDGQHRIEGLRDYPDIVLPTVMIIGAENDVAFRTFATINEKQDKVSKILLNYIKWEIGDFDDKLTEEAYEIVKSLYSDSDSPLENKIRLFEDEKSKWVNSPTLTKLIRNIISVHGPIHNLPLSKKLAFIKSYLQAWKNLYPAAWAPKTRREYILTKAMGFTIIFRLFSRIFRRCRLFQKGEYTVESFEQEINQLKGKTIELDDNEIPLTWTSDPFGKMSSGKGINLIVYEIMRMIPEE